MARKFITIREVGEDVCWLLVQQAMGIPDAKMQSDFMKDKIAMLMFTMQSLPERLCVTAAVRQMSGTTIYQGDPGGIWRQEVHDFQKHLFPIFGYYLDCIYVYGFITERLPTNDSISFPVINAGSSHAHPAHALADLACMLKICKSLEGVEAAWVGCDNGTMYSLLEATAWFPISLKISLPPQIDPAPAKEIVERLKTPVQFVATPQEAVKNARFVFAGKREDVPHADISPWNVDKNWVIDANLMQLADPGARLLLSASPARAIPIASEVLNSGRALLTRQAEYRLRIHKRILHWVFGK